MGLKFLVFLIVGLGALYTIHLLAQDFSKLAAGAQTVASTLFGKRDLDDISRRSNLSIVQREFENEIDWNTILKRDPLKCALSLVCQLSAGAEKNNDEANKIYEFISHAIENSKVPEKLKDSYQQGLDFNQNQQKDYTKCFQNFSYCPYSAKTMLKLISFNKLLFG